MQPEARQQHLQMHLCLADSAAVSGTLMVNSRPVLVSIKRQDNAVLGEEPKIHLQYL